MNKYDWISVGMVLFGIYLFVEAVLELAGSIAQWVTLPAQFTASGQPLQSVVQAALVAVILKSFVGTCLIFLAPVFTAVLARRDQRLAARPLSTAPAPPAAAPSEG